MSDPRGVLLDRIISEINDLRRRVEAQETGEYVARAGDADTLDGLHADAFALSGHNHDAAYAALSHNHDHGALTGRGDDDHTQYYNAARHTAAVHNSLGLDHGSLSGRGDDDHTQYLLASGARALSNNWDAGNYQVRARTFYADVATGTAPLTIASTTQVANLNADLLDGSHASAFAAASHTHDNRYYTESESDNRYRQISAGYVYVPYNPSKTSTAWDGDSKAAGTYDISPSTFGYASNAKALQVRMCAQWSAVGTSNAIYCRLYGGSSAQVVCRSQAASVLNESCGIVHLDGSGRFQVVATGTGPSAVWLEIVGYFI